MSKYKSLLLDGVRRSFPALAGDHVFLDNAAGSQVLGAVVDRIRDFYIHHNVQLGGRYPAGQKAMELHEEGYEAAARFIGAERDEIALGASTTQLLRNIAMILEVRPFQEVIVSHADHEANLYPWVDLVRERNIADDVGRVTYGKKSRLRDPDYANKVVLKTWTPDTTSESCSPTNPKLLASSLIPLLSKNTRLVCLPHVSNILGTIHDVRSICDIVRKYNRDALVCVDGVAYAPHRPLDVRALGVDIYAFSWHKTFGPHLAQVYISPRARSDLKIGYYPRRIGNQYHLRDTLETKIGLSGASDELVCAIPAVVNYLRQQGRWAWIVKHETELQETLLAWLRSREDVTVWGETDGTRAQDRVATVSFTVRGWRSKDIVRRVAEESGGKVGIWAGSFKSYELTHTVLKLDPMDGVVRVSMVHYNTVQEIKQLIALLEKILDQSAQQMPESKL